MSKSRRAYAPEFRHQLVELLQAPEELAREFVAFVLDFRIARGFIQRHKDIICR